MVKSLLQEIALQKDYLAGEPVRTIYFGGGTPSLLQANELQALLAHLQSTFQVVPGAEITLEANPDDLTPQKIKALKGTPINRFSIGVQSFYDEDLQLMNRAHTSAEASDAIRLAQDNGFDNLTSDLIYGIPTLTEHKWRNNLQAAFGLDIKHISAYCLTVEPKTALAHAVKTGKISNVDEQQSAAHFEIMLNAMQQQGFIQYEISNFCKEGFHSRHNSNYWLKENYLGLGPSAHSYNGSSRQWNIANNALYIRSLQKDELNFESETLTPAQRYNEYVLTSLRTVWGTPMEQVKKNYGDAFAAYCLKEVQKYIASGDVRFERNQLFLTDKGKLIADKIAADLFWVG